MGVSLSWKNRLVSIGAFLRNTLIFPEKDTKHEVLKEFEALLNTKRLCGIGPPLDRIIIIKLQYR